jgi:hypothetical protein
MNETCIHNPRWRRPLLEGFQQLFHTEEVLSFILATSSPDWCLLLVTFGRVTIIFHEVSGGRPERPKCKLNY